MSINSAPCRLDGASVRRLAHGGRTPPKCGLKSVFVSRLGRGSGPRSERVVDVGACAGGGVFVPNISWHFGR